jgi:hypothetical protein
MSTTTTANATNTTAPTTGATIVAVDGEPDDPWVSTTTILGPAGGDGTAGAGAALPLHSKEVHALAATHGAFWALDASQHTSWEQYRGGCVNTHWLLA